MPLAFITQSMAVPPVLHAPRQCQRFFPGVMTSDGLRSSWNGQRPSRSAPCRCNLMSRASASRCTDTSRFSRSTSCSGIRAILPPSAEKPVKWFFQFLQFFIPFAKYTRITCILAAVDFRRARKWTLQSRPVMPAKKPRKTHSVNASFALSKRAASLRSSLPKTQARLRGLISYYETEAELPPARGAHCARPGPGSHQRTNCSAIQAARAHRARSLSTSSGFGRDFRRWTCCRRRTREP